MGLVAFIVELVFVDFTAVLDEEGVCFFEGATKVVWLGTDW